MKKIKIGILGAGRGEMMMKYCVHADNAELVAVCDKNSFFLNRVRDKLSTGGIVYYTDFEQFLQQDMDAVVLANYATEHAPFAIQCLKAGKHVLSEVLPCQTLKEAVELVEAVEQSEKIYAYGENYCFMPAPMEMRRLYRQGKLGEFEYGEGEYFHNCESLWPEITQGDPEHWRNNMPSPFYCTHSVGPLLHISGLRPVKVTGFELPFNARCARMGYKGGLGALEILELENGSIIKSAHGIGISRDSVWYSIYGSKGRIESAREDAQAGGITQLYCNLDKFEGENATQVLSYKPKDRWTAIAAEYGHGGSDYYTMWNFVERIKQNPDAVTIDIYEALDMSLPGLLAYESVRKGGIPIEIPDFRHPLIRETFRYNTTCTNKEKAGDMYIPSYSRGEMAIPKETYDRITCLWEKKRREE